MTDKTGETSDQPRSSVPDRDWQPDDALVLHGPTGSTQDVEVIGRSGAYPETLVRIVATGQQVWVEDQKLSRPDGEVSR